MLAISEYQDALRRWHDREWADPLLSDERNAERMALKLGEEGAEVEEALIMSVGLHLKIGKVMEAIIKSHRGHPKPVFLGAELADVVIVTLILADYKGIDLQQELDKKITDLPGFNWMNIYAPQEPL